MLTEAQLKDLLPLTLTETHLPLDQRLQGKVRDAYPLPGGQRLLISPQTASRPSTGFWGQCPAKARC